jgi:hypothetical protein
MQHQMSYILQNPGAPSNRQILSPFDSNRKPMIRDSASFTPATIADTATLQSRCFIWREPGRRHDHEFRDPHFINIFISVFMRRRIQRNQMKK